MEGKEIRKWRNEEALKRYGLISPLLDPDIDEAKRCMLREQIAERAGISKRTIYRYDAGYRTDGFEGLVPMNREKRRN